MTDINNLELVNKLIWENESLHETARQLLVQVGERDAEVAALNARIAELERDLELLNNEFGYQSSSRAATEYSWKIICALKDYQRRVELALHTQRSK